MKMKSASILAGLLALSFLPCASAQDNAPIRDKDIRVTHFEALNYPAIAKSADIKGVVVVRVILDDRGDVSKASAISGNELFIRYCIDNVKKWKFQPNARKAAVIVYNFRLPMAACGPVDSFFTFEGANLVTVTACPRTVETAR